MPKIKAIITQQINCKNILEFLVKVNIKQTQKMKKIVVNESSKSSENKQ
ncbi:hypothetical protein [Rickettsia rhipicephali]|nr:hypothetical protein [Rickettsia rhipicephali]